MNWDVAFDALGDEYRRRVLARLLEREDVTVPEEVQTGEESLEELHLALRHQHLPRLQAEGFVDWDPDRQRVSRGPAFGDIRPVVELLHEYAREQGEPWI